MRMLFSLVRTWVSSEDVPAGKPAPDMYLEAARRLGFEGHEALAFEDSPAGAQAARDAGTKVMIYTPAGTDPAKAPEGYGRFDSFRDPQLWEAARAWVAKLQAAQQSEATQG